MLEICGVRVTFGALAAVDGVDLTVADGRVMALVGPSGCGKSTLLRAVAGLERLDAGLVRFDGADLARVPVNRRGFGLMFQDGVLFPHRTVAGNVRYGIARRPDADRRVGELLEMVGLAGYGDRRVTELSGGEAQRVALARALAPRPRVLLLDEPLAALDPALRSSLLADLRAVLERTATTAIFVTHDHQEAFAIADTVAVMRAGAIVQTGPPRAVWGNPVDEWTARFLGCDTVIAADPARDDRGGQASMTRFGAVPYRADRVGLRAAALALDAAGPIEADVLAAIPGLTQQQLVVRLRAPGGVVDAGAAGTASLAAVADAGTPVTAGARIRLRFDPAHTVPIGPPGRADRRLDQREQGVTET